MVKVKKTAGLIMAVVMILSMLMTGCGQTGNTVESSNSAGTQAQTESQTQKPAEEAAKLVWYMRGVPPKNAESVFAKANEHILQKINATVDFQVINSGDFESKCTLGLTAGEPIDLMFTSNWANKYEPNVLKGSYAVLDDYIAKYPQLQQLISQNIWDTVKVSGKIYGIPNLQILYTQDGLCFKKEYVDKYNIDITKIKTIDDLTTVFQTIKDNEPDVTVYLANSGNPFNASYFIKDYYPNIASNAYADPKTWKVVDISDLPEYQYNYKVLREWNKKGFYAADAATAKDAEPIIKSGKWFANYYPQKAGGEAEWKAKYGHDIIQLATGSAIINRKAGTGTMTAIPENSKNKDKAFALISLMATDKELMNLLTYGIEGQDYKKTGENKIEKIPDTYSLAGWSIGNTFNSFTLPGQPDNLPEVTKKNNDDAQLDPLTGFYFDTKDVLNEIMQLDAATKDFTTILYLGLDDVEKILKARAEKIKAAGLDKLKDEAQKQLDAWRAAKQ